MNFMKLAKERYSVRKFTDKKVEQEKLDLILEAGRIAPTGANNHDKINANCKCIFGAQTVLMIANDRDREWKNPLEPGVSAGVEDVSIVATHMMLEAWELGIGSCWVNFFSPSAVKKAFDLPKNEEVVLLLPIGYTDKLSRPSAMHKKSREMEDMVTVL